MRLENAMKNIKVAMLFQVSTLLLNFIDRKLFLELLGVEYLGIHGLFTNMISMLALAELGVGTAIIYNLYEPLAKGDESAVANLMHIYRRFYFWIGCVIGLIGMGMMVTLPLFVKDVAIPMGEIRSVYIVFVLGTVATYWTGYKRSLLYADQQNYKLLLGDMSANAMGMLVKIGCLLLWPRYMTYVVIHVVTKVIPNLYAMRLVDKKYTYLKYYKKAEVDKKVNNKVTRNIKDLFVHKISEFVVMSTDNMILSLAVGIQAVGKVANYNLIIMAVLSFVAKGIDAIQASVGNLVTTSSREKVYEVYERLNFLCFWIGSVTAVCLIGLTQPFIELWIGKRYLLDNKILLVLVLNYVLCVMSRPLWQMMSVSGLFKEDKRNAIAEMVVNLVVSLMLVYRLGIIGVFIGTTCSWVVAWYLKSRVLYRHFFKMSTKTYGIHTLGYTGLIILEMILVLQSFNYIKIENVYIAFGIKLVLCIMIPMVVNILLFWRHTSFRYFLERIQDMLKEVLNDSNRYDKWLTMIMCILILIVPLHGSVLPVGDLIGNLASLSIIGISGLYILWHLFNKKTNPAPIRYLLWGYIGLMVCLCISGMITGGLAGVKVAVWMGFMTCVGVACALMDWSQLGRRILVIDVGILMWIGHAYIFFVTRKDIEIIEKIQGWVYESFYYIYINPNFTGMMFALLGMLLIIAYSQKKGERYVLYMALLIPLLLETRGRTALLALVSVGIVYMLWFVTSRWRITHILLGIGVIAVSIVIVFVYPNLEQWEGLAKLNEVIKAAWGKSLLSGREDVWKDAFLFISQEPLWGYGLETTLQELTGDIYHAHNQFLHTLLQGGIVGVSILISTLSAIWLSLYKVKETPVARVVGSVLVGIIVMGLFENTLLGDNIRQGILQWGMLGVGLSAVISRYRKMATFIDTTIVEEYTKTNVQ